MAKQGKTGLARQMLAGLHQTFVEGFDSVDWQEAGKLLKALGQ
jgi:hypothetical protein